MSSAQLLAAQQLTVCLSEPDLLILDCRLASRDPSYSARVYRENHTPDTYFADFERDLSAPVRRGVTGRHPLPNPAELTLKLQVWGLCRDGQVVLYDNGPGASIARAWQLLHWLGKRDGVYLLDGDLAAWKAAGLALINGESSLRPDDFQDRPDALLLTDAATLQVQLSQPGPALLNAHAQSHFYGEIEPIDPVAGHIPDAQCVASTDNLSSDGYFPPPE